MILLKPAWNNAETYLDLTGKSKQEIFSKAYLGMKAQDFAPSYIVEEEDPINPGKVYCVYLSPDKKRCAIGHLFDEKALEHVGLIGTDVYGLISHNYIKCDRNSDTRMFLEALQRCHDSPIRSDARGAPTQHEIDQMKIDIRRNFQVFANTYDLTIPE